MTPMKYWEIVADKLSAAGWSWGYCSAVTQDGWRWIVDAHREGRRYNVHSGECAAMEHAKHLSFIGREPKCLVPNHLIPRAPIRAFVTWMSGELLVHPIHILGAIHRVARQDDPIRVV